MYHGEWSPSGSPSAKNPWGLPPLWFGHNIFFRNLKDRGVQCNHNTSHFHWSYWDVNGVIEGFYRGVTQELQGCYPGVTEVLKGYFRGVTRVLLLSYRDVTGVL